MCGGLLCCGVLCWRVFFPHYGGATRRGRVRPSVSFHRVSLFCTLWSGGGGGEGHAGGFVAWVIRLAGGGGVIRRDGCGPRGLCCGWLWWRVGRKAGYGGRVFVGESPLGVCASVWWCSVSSKGSLACGGWSGGWWLACSRPACSSLIVPPSRSPSPVLWPCSLPSPGVSVPVSVCWLLPWRGRRLGRGGVGRGGVVFSLSPFVLALLSLRAGTGSWWA